jgi:hypothetical protein
MWTTVNIPTSCAITSANIVSTVKSATSGRVATALIISTVKSVKSHSALIAKLPCLATNAGRAFVLVAERLSLVTMNASILFATSTAKKNMLFVVQKAKRVLPKRMKNLTLEKLTRSIDYILFTNVQVVASTNTTDRTD